MFSRIIAALLVVLALVASFYAAFVAGQDSRYEEVMQLHAQVSSLKSELTKTKYSLACETVLAESRYNLLFKLREAVAELEEDVELLQKRLEISNRFCNNYAGYYKACVAAGLGGPDLSPPGPGGGPMN